MAIERWRPFGSSMLRWDRGFGEFQTEMNRLFDTFFGRTMTLDGPERVWAPAVDVRESKDDLVVSCEVPGMSEKDFTVSITGDVLTIKGERVQPVSEAKDESYHRLERWHGKFERHLLLPMPLQPDKAQASYRDGVLEVRLPKAEETKPKEIKVNLL